MRASTWGIVGTGAVASALATRLTLHGHPVLLYGRDVAAAMRIAERCGERAAAVSEPRDLAGVRAIVIAVSDKALANVADDLARDVPAETPPGMRRVALHTSGARGVEVLYSLAKAGFLVGGVHPLAALAPGSDGAPLAGAWFALEGEPAALAVARALVAALRGEELVALRGEGVVALRGEGSGRGSARELVLGREPGAKLRYHAAASLVSGGVVALLALAEDAFVASGVERDAARAALATLAEGAVVNVAARGPAAALTGPAARGDAALVGGQLSVLAPEASAVYRALLPRLAALASARGSLDGAAAAALRELATREPQRGSK